MSSEHRGPHRRTEAQKAAAIQARMASVAASERVFVHQEFRRRGMSDRTVNALIDRGIDAPERLLFAAEADLKNIPGIG
jgi:hypothetical protein